VFFQRLAESFNEHSLVVVRFVDEGVVVSPLEDVVDGIRAYDTERPAHGGASYPY